MINYLKSGLWIISFIILFSCDVVEKPLKEQAGSCGDDNAAVPIKKILIEEYTGHLCGNCPRAAEELERLKSVYCDHIVPLSIHVGFFARPDGDDYPSDFRTETGDALNAHYGATNMGLPRGVINRSMFNDAWAVSHQTVWQAAIESLLEQAPQLDIVVDNNYNNDSRELTVSVSVEYFLDILEDLSITVYLAEDSIIAPQRDYSLNLQRIENYAHRHVLRETLTDTWGELITHPTLRGNVSQHSYSTVLDSYYEAGNCELIVFISYTESREILQATADAVSD